MNTRFHDSQLAATESAQANKSPRYHRLESLERWVNTTQYDGRPDWFADCETPLRERRPCIAYPIIRAAIDSNTDLCLGEGRFPSVCLSDTEQDDDSELGTDARKAANAALAKITKLGKIKPAARDAFAQAQGMRSVAVIAGVRNGKPFADVEPAKWCTPEFNQDGSIRSLEIFYPYTREVQDERGEWMVEAWLYRRVIDESSDTTFQPIRAERAGIKPKNWQPEPTMTVQHGLGFCPVVWYPFMIGCSTVARFDGRAIHEHCHDEVFALDVALSQWHRAAFYAGDPQIVEYNVEVSATGRAVSETSDPHVIVSTPDGFRPGGSNRPNGGYLLGAPRARKKSPGQVWSVDAPPGDAKIELLELSGDALRPIQEHCQDLRNKISESLCVVFTDPESVKHATALSGKAQVMLRSRQLDRCDQYRDDLADGLLIPLYRMLVRVCAAVGDGITSRIIRDGVAAIGSTGDLSLDLKWGNYFQPDEDDELKVAQFVAAADKVVPLPDRVKLHKLARALDVENVEELLAEIEQERQSRREHQVETMHHEAAVMASMAKADGAVGTRNRGPAGAGAAADARGRGGVAAGPAAKGDTNGSGAEGRGRSASR